MPFSLLRKRTTQPGPIRRGTHRAHSTLSYPAPVPARITPKELEAAMDSAVDEDGNDIRLAEAVAAMTPEQRRQSEENLRRSIDEARASLRKQREQRDL